MFKLQNHNRKIFLWSCGFSVLKPILCEGALRHRNTREQFSNNLRAVGPNHARSVEDETEQKTRQQTRHRGQNKVNK